MMTDWREAGRKADAKLVLNLYRRAFISDSKIIARERTIAALRAAGAKTVLDLWGGGISAEALVAVGFDVISVEDGSMELTDPQGRTVSTARKRRALEYAGIEAGYKTRFGKAEHFAHEADAAYLDFCGPWSKSARLSVTACRHMKCVAVTLTPDHDLSTDASSMHERQMAYQLFLKMAWSAKPRWEAMSAGGGVRRLLDYRRERGFAVFLYLLSRQPIHIPALRLSQRIKTRPDMHQRTLAIKRDHYHRLSPERKKQWNARTRERAKNKYHVDAVYRAKVQLKARHRSHERGAIPKSPCELCVAG